MKSLNACRGGTQRNHQMPRAASRLHCTRKRGHCAAGNPSTTRSRREADSSTDRNVLIAVCEASLGQRATRRATSSVRDQALICFLMGCATSLDQTNWSESMRREPLDQGSSRAFPAPRALSRLPARDVRGQGHVLPRRRSTRRSNAKPCAAGLVRGSVEGRNATSVSVRVERFIAHNRSGISIQSAVRLPDQAEALSAERSAGVLGRESRCAQHLAMDGKR